MLKQNLKKNTAIIITVLYFSGIIKTTMIFHLMSSLIQKDVIHFHSL